MNNLVEMILFVMRKSINKNTVTLNLTRQQATELIGYLTELNDIKAQREMDKKYHESMRKLREHYGH